MRSGPNRRVKAQGLFVESHAKRSINRSSAKMSRDQLGFPSALSKTNCSGYKRWKGDCEVNGLGAGAAGFSKLTAPNTFCKAFVPICKCRCWCPSLPCESKKVVASFPPCFCKESPGPAFSCPILGLPQCRREPKPLSPQILLTRPSAQTP